jgi:hypothetical protein
MEFSTIVLSFSPWVGTILTSFLRKLPLVEKEKPIVMPGEEFWIPSAFHSFVFLQ